MVDQYLWAYEHALADVRNIFLLDENKRLTLFIECQTEKSISQQNTSCR